MSATGKILRVAAALVTLCGVGMRDVLAAVLHVPTADYPTIQAAVDAAAPGDEVRVGPGTYAELVTITKSLSLRADPEYGAILDGSTITDPVVGTAILIESATNVSVQGFVVRSYLGAGIRLSTSQGCRILSNRVEDIRWTATSGPISGQCIAVQVSSSFNTVAGNTVSGGRVGIGMGNGSTDNTVKENTISNIANFGINVTPGTMPNAQPAVRNTIKENVVCAGQIGVLIIPGPITGILMGNTVKENRIVADIGIWLQPGTSGNTVKENACTSIDDDGTGNILKENAEDPTLECP